MTGHETSCCHCERSEAISRGYVLDIYFDAIALEVEGARCEAEGEQEKEHACGILA